MPNSHSSSSCWPRTFFGLRLIGFAGLVLMVASLWQLRPARAAAAVEVSEAVERATLASPDGRVRLTVTTLPQAGGAELRYQIEYDSRPIIVPSCIKLLQGKEAIGERLSGVTFGTPSTNRSEWKPVYGERSTVTDHYNELAVTATAPGARGLKYTFRCYDAGVAFRTEVEGDKPIKISGERSEFRFAKDAEAWRTTTAQGAYEKVRLSKLGKGVERPLVVRLDSSTYAAVAEANLVDYARMLLRVSADDPLCVVSELGSGVLSRGPRLVTPWRVVMLGDRPGQLLENNDLFLNLSEPCQLADTSWIKPGKVLREITLTTAGGKAAVDFAAANGFQHIEFDAGWYGHEYDPSSDATTISVDPKRSPGPLDLLGVVRYARERGLGVILYVNRRALERQLDEILPLYAEWGISGVKYGFVRTGSQEWTRWLHDAVRKAADHRLMIDIHDEYRPTGFSRTYPNLMTQEGVRGDEETPPTEQTLTTLFTRSVAGAADFTICYFNPRVDEHWSHAHQLAKAVCIYSPWHFIYWYDTPLQAQVGNQRYNRIVNTPELEFFRQMPTTWDETRVLHGEIGEYAVVARRSGEDWFVGALNNSSPRTLTVKLDFLPAARQHQATRYRDDPTVSTPTKVRVEQVSVTAGDSLTLTLPANGGEAIHVRPVR